MAWVFQAESGFHAQLAWTDVFVREELELIVLIRLCRRTIHGARFKLFAASRR